MTVSSDQSRSDGPLRFGQAERDDQGDGRDSGGNRDRRLRMLQHPALRQLRSLKLPTHDSRGHVDEVSFAAISAMPFLASLP